MSTPVATIADALIAFILSLLHDPAAVEEFTAAPQAMLASNGLQGACAADVQAVKPVIVDNPTVIVKQMAAPQPIPQYNSGNHHNDSPDEVIREITRIVNQFTTIDARSTIVDQSTNQNIWTNGGDVTQIFDQEAVVASGDDSVAGGRDATAVDADVDVTIGDVSVGNTTNDGSFNNTGVEETVIEETVVTTEVVDDPALAGVAADAVTVVDVGAVAGAAVDTAVDATLNATVSAVAPVEASTAPAENTLAVDLTSAADTYENDDSGIAVADDAYVEEPVEEQ